MIANLILFALSCYLLYILLAPKRPKNFPPGPPSYPFVGSTLALTKLGSVTTYALQKLGEIYGPISGVFIGNDRAIVINGYEATKEFYARDDFPHRPFNLFLSELWNGRMLGVFFSNGRLWQEQRRFTLRHLRDFGFGKTSMEGLIHEETEACINSIQKSIKAAGSDSVISVDDQFGVSVINILWAIMSGKRYNHEDEAFKKMLKVIQHSFRSGRPGGMLVNAYPFLRHFPYFKQQLEAITSGPQAIIGMLKETIDEHLKTRDDEGTPRDLIDVYIDAMKESNNDSNTTFSMDQLTQICEDLFAAGSESTSNSIAYAILHMLRNPECQEKVQQELDEVVGRDRLPSYEDRQKLPYTFAAVTESFRMSPVAPISVPHYNIEDVKLLGYDIPKGTTAMVNYSSTNLDKKYWGDPEIFRPERFLDENGAFITSKLDHVMGFGAGKRQCLGEPLARITNFIVFTSVIQKFKFELIAGTSKPTLEPVDGFTVAPYPFSAKVTSRF